MTDDRDTVGKFGLSMIASAIVASFIGGYMVGKDLAGRHNRADAAAAAGEP